MDDDQKNKAEQTYSWLTSLLTGWGLKQSWAQYIAAAIVGAACAVLALLCSGCSVNASQGADGSWSYSSELIAPSSFETPDGIIIRTLDGEEK